MHVFPQEAVMGNDLAIEIHKKGCKASKIIRVVDENDNTKTVQVVYVLDVLTQQEGIDRSSYMYSLECWKDNDLLRTMVEAAE